MAQQDGPGGAPGLQLQLLGRPCFRRADGTRGDLGKKYVAVLACVALRRAAVQRRDILALGLWDDANALYQAEHELRTALGRDAMTRGRSLALLPDVHCDIFEDLDTWSTQALLDRSVFLDGVDIDTRWLLEQRVVWLAKVLNALLLRAHALQPADHLPAALRLAGRINQLAPGHEDGWRASMWLHYLSHDLAGAQQAHAALLKALPAGRAPSRETQAQWQVVQQAQRSPWPAAPNPALSRPPQLVGRQPQRAAMDDACSRALAFVLCGEAGSGKSHLLADFCARRGPAFVFTVLPRADRRPWTALLSLLDELDQHFETPAAADDRMLLAALVQHRQAADAPAVRAGMHRLLQRIADAHRLRCVGIDDLQHADEATVALCCALAADGLTRQLRLGLAIDSAAAPALQALLAAAPVRRIDLPALACAEVGELLSTLQLGGAATALSPAALHAHAGGNPMLLLETLRALPSDWAPGQPLPQPAAALRACQARLRDLAPALQPLVQLAAVLGSDVLHAERILGLPAQQFGDGRAALQRHGVWAGDDFVHALMRQAAVDALTPGQRLHWSGCAAAVLQHEPAMPRARLAALWEGAQRWAEAAAAHLDTGLLAEEAGQAEAARTAFAHSAACARAGGLDAAEFRALYLALPAELLLRDPRPAQVLAQRLGALATSPWQRAALAVARALLAVSAYSREPAAQAQALAATAAAIRAGLRFDDLHCDALALDGAALAQAGQLDAALDASRRAMALAESLGRGRQQREIGTTCLYVCYETSRIGEGLPLGRDLFDAYEAAGDAVGAAAMEGHVATMLGWVDAAQALPVARSAVQRHRAIAPAASGPMAVMHRVALAGACLHAGHFGEALDALHEGGSLIGADLPTNIRARVQLTLAHAWLLLGQEQAARSALGSDEQGWPTAMQMQRCWALVRAARLAGRDGAGHLRRIGRLHVPQALAHTAWLEWSRQGDAPAVAAQMQEVGQRYAQAGMPGLAHAAALRRIDRLLACDPPAAAAEALVLQQQLHAGAGLNAATDVPEAWLVLSRALAQGGHAAQAQAAQQAGRDWMARALPQLQPTWVDGFLQRNPVNRALWVEPG